MTNKTEVQAAATSPHRLKAVVPVAIGLKKGFKETMDELAYTYPEEKVGEALAEWDMMVPEDTARQQELAAAIDAGLLEATCAGLDLAAPVDGDVANYLLGRVLVFTGNYKNYLGYASDPDIYSKLIYTWNSFDQVLEPTLQQGVNDLIREGVITGYNIKRTASDASFRSYLRRSI